MTTLAYRCMWLQLTAAERAEIEPQTRKIYGDTDTPGIFEHLCPYEMLIEIERRKWLWKSI